MRWRRSRHFPKTGPRSRANTQSPLITLPTATFLCGYMMATLLTPICIHPIYRISGLFDIVKRHCAATLPGPGRRRHARWGRQPHRASRRLGRGIASSFRGWVERSAVPATRLGTRCPNSLGQHNSLGCNEFRPLSRCPTGVALDNLIRRSQYLTRRRAAPRAPGLADHAGGVPAGRRSGPGGSDCSLSGRPPSTGH
jgi:hypothetical protein